MTEQHDLQQLVVGRFQVGEQANFFQRIERHRLRLLDQQHHLLASRMLGDQFVLQQADHFVGPLAGRIDAQFAGNHAASDNR